jgi:hypothetical protein
VGDLLAPRAPDYIAAAHLEEGALTDLTVKLGYTAARFSTDWVARQLHLPLPLTDEVLVQLCRDGLAEEVLQTARGRCHYWITQRGREHGVRLLEVTATSARRP